VAPLAVTANRVRSIYLLGCILFSYFMTIELASKRLDYWMRKLGLYQHCECLAAAQTNGRLCAVLKRLGHKVPKGFTLPKTKHTRYVTASDDWHPSYRDGKVAITWHNDDRRISVWGDDDFGMEKTDTCRMEFDAIVASEPISQEMLRKRGFIFA
jgi:hypothetical protein